MEEMDYDFMVVEMLDKMKDWDAECRELAKRWREIYRYEKNMIQ